MQSPTGSHHVDQELEDTFPASDPPSMSTPSTATTRDDAHDGSSDGGWIDLYRIEDAAAHAAGQGDIGGGAVLQRREADVRFSTSAALALLNHLVDGGADTGRVRLIRARAELERIAAPSPIGGNPHAREASFPEDHTRHTEETPGLFVISAVSPADREVLWQIGHPDAGELRVLSNTTFDLDPRLLALGKRSAGE